MLREFVIRVTESRRIYQLVTELNESRHTYESCQSVNESYQPIMSVSHVAHVNEACHTHTAHVTCDT